MKIVSFVLGLLLSLIVLGASLFAIGASALGGIAGETAAAESMMTSGVLGLFLSILGTIGASLAFKHKVASSILLFLTMMFLILVGSYTIHKNMIVFGGLFFLPALFAAVSKKEQKSGRQPLGKEGQKLSKKITQDLQKEQIITEKLQRKRDKEFLKCWKKGMSDEELARKFNVNIQGVKALKKRLKGNDYK